MSRLAWSQLRFRSGRALALLLGMLVAATAFTVLTAAARTAQVRTIGAVRAHFRPAYDILVRPRGARSRLESATGTVQPDFLSGIYGGITTAQWHQIQHLSGVQVAAPIAMVGYGFMNADFPVWLPHADVARPGRQLYRASTTWVSANGASRIRQPPTYVYVTPDRVHTASSTGATTETVPGGSKVTTCPALHPTADPFSPATLTMSWCWSKANGLGEKGQLISPDLMGRPGFGVDWQFPMLIAAVDPVAEARLDGLSRALTSGHYLPETYPGVYDGVDYRPGGPFPMLATTDSGVGEYSVTRVQQLAAPPAPPVLNQATMSRDLTRPGRPVLGTTITARQAYQYLLRRMRSKLGRLVNAVQAYWSVGPVRYRRNTGGDLVPATVRNPISIWRLPGAGIFYAPLDNAGLQYRTVREHAHVISSTLPVPIMTGTFSTAKIQAFDPLSRVPLGPYEPTAAAPANAASRHALGGSDLLPSLNLGGYVSPPVQLITTMAALPSLESRQYGGGAQLARAPISVIRVRIAGVTGPNPASLNRIRGVAEQIELRTHLTVDIVAGSSPSPTTISLPAGSFGRPPLLLTEDWVRKGVAVTILDAVDRSSVVLFVLILVVCALFVANSASAAVRGRRPELGVLACLGWTRPRLFAAVLSEVALIGLVAGLLGALLSPPLAAALGLHASVARAVLAIPVAMALAIGPARCRPGWRPAPSRPTRSGRPCCPCAAPATRPGSPAWRSSMCSVPRAARSSARSAWPSA